MYCSIVYNIAFKKVYCISVWVHKRSFAVSRHTFNGLDMKRQSWRAINGTLMDRQWLATSGLPAKAFNQSTHG